MHLGLTDGRTHVTAEIPHTEAAALHRAAHPVSVFFARTSRRPRASASTRSVLTSWPYGVRRSAWRPHLSHPQPLEAVTGETQFEFAFMRQRLPVRAQDGWIGSQRPVALRFAAGPSGQDSSHAQQTSRVNPADAHRHGTSAGPPSHSRVRVHPQVPHGHRQVLSTRILQAEIGASCEQCLEGHCHGQLSSSPGRHT